MIIPAVTIGPIPNSIKVPLLEAKIILDQNIGSSPPYLTNPNNGIYEHIKNIIKLNKVQIILSFNGTFLTGFSTSGK